MTPRIQLYDPSTAEASPKRKRLTMNDAAAANAAPKNLFDQTYEERWSDAGFQKVANAWNLTKEEEEQLLLLKQHMTDVTSWKNNPLDIVRYLRGPGKFETVEPKFREMIEWREQHGADRLLEDYRPPKGLLWYVPSAILKGYDKEGDPIYLERGGVMDGIGLLRFKREDMYRHCVWLREIGTRGDWIQDFEKKTGRTPSQVTIIYDMQGMSSRHLKAGVIPMFKDIVAMNQTRYCGLAKRIILLRAPSIFQFVWNIAKHFFPPEGRKLMVFTGPSNYQQVLDKFVDRKVLPPCICKEGRGSAMDGMPQNFEGGIIPSNTEASIPDQAWIRAFMNGEACPKRSKEKDTATTISLPSSPRKNDLPPPRLLIPPVCLSEYKNVKIMIVPQAQWQDEFETVLVK